MPHAEEIHMSIRKLSLSLLTAALFATPVLAVRPVSIHDRFGHALTSALPIARPERG